jgi:hypothetical protein
MKKVKIVEWKSEVEFESTMPVIPNIGDGVGMWINGDWATCEVLSIIYEFNKDGTFLLVEITVTSDSWDN